MLKGKVAGSTSGIGRRRRGELGWVDILVNNAGIQFVAPVESFPDEKWDAIIAINLSAAFHATKAALPGMRQRRWGRASTSPRPTAASPASRRRPTLRPSTASSA
jgi:3-hydroxybutyrate dehydrogenase